MQESKRGCCFLSVSIACTYDFLTFSLLFQRTESCWKHNINRILSTERFHRNADMEKDDGFTECNQVETMKLLQRMQVWSLYNQSFQKPPPEVISMHDEAWTSCSKICLRWAAQQSFVVQVLPEPICLSWATATEEACASVSENLLTISNSAARKRISFNNNVLYARTCPSYCTYSSTTTTFSMSRRRRATATKDRCSGRKDNNSSCIRQSVTHTMMFLEQCFVVGVPEKSIVVASS